MGIKEFSLKTTLFIILPALLLYTCSRLQEQQASDWAGCKRCVRMSGQPGLSGAVLTGYRSAPYTNENLWRQPITNPAALQRLQRLVQGLRPVRVVPGATRPAVRWYRLALAHGPDTCEVDLYQLPTGRELAYCVSYSGDSAFAAPHLVGLTDSLFHVGVPGQP